MPTLVDFSQVAHASIHVLNGNNIELSEDTVRHMVLNSLKAMRKKFVNDYGELVICVDAGNIWRKEIFPYYKASRAESREASTIDWPAVYRYIDNVTEDLAQHFPYKVVRVNRAEADDVIAVLCDYFQTEELNENGLIAEPQKIMIISSDGDLKQLQSYPNVSQYSNIQDKLLREKDPKKFLKEKIIRGDKGDGIPNIRSQDDSFVMKIRQKAIRAVEVDEWLTQDPEEFCNDMMLERYHMNNHLVNLQLVPRDIYTDIVETYKTAFVADRRNLLTYFINNRLKNLQSELQYF